MQSNDERLDFGPWALASLIFIVVLLLGFVFASQFRGWPGAFGMAGLIFLSAGAVGALLGFIFAVPRVIARDGTDAKGADAGTKLLSTNTNLERISDWLTTMLVGVGLSQLTNLNAVFLQFRNFLAEAATVYDVDGHPSAGVLPAVGPFILVLGAASGFLFMYLMTRLVLVSFFRQSEEVLSGAALAAIQVALTGAQQDQRQPSENVGATAPTDVSAEAGEERAPDGTARPLQFATATSSRATTAAFRRASQATTLSNDDALEVMFGLLYQAGGYQRVIQMSGELSRTSIIKRPEYWFYLAAAFGQAMYHTAKGGDDWQTARDNALDAASRAIQIDKSFRARLWGISNPNSSDNDLALLRDDPNFRRLVGH